MLLDDGQRPVFLIHCDSCAGEQRGRDYGLIKRLRLRSTRDAERNVSCIVWVDVPEV